MTRADYEAKAHDAVLRWAAAFGLEGAWRFTTTLTGPDRDQRLDGKQAVTHIRHHRRWARVILHERTRPEFYDLNAAHEVLHVLFGPIERAIDELAEPAKTLMDDAMHSAIERLSCVLAGKSPQDDDEELGERPPWEAAPAERGKA